jgi:hypothetical protein
LIKILLICAVLIGAGWIGWRSFGNILHPDRRQAINPASQAATPSVVKLPPAPATTREETLPSNPPATVEAVGVYVFRNRPVPPPPFDKNGSATGGGLPDSRGLQLAVDLGVNAWIMRGPPLEVDQAKRIAEFVDLEQSELDLDFVLIAVSDAWLSRFGIAASYEAGAPWATAITLGGAGGNLRVTSGQFSAVVDMEHSDSSLRLVSSPVVRCVTGEPWEFAADEQVPISSVARSEGVVSTGYVYQKIGLGFSGIVHKAGPNGAYRLTVTQRNGSVDTGDTGKDSPPRLKSQDLASSLVVEVGRWSCLGGVSSWRIEKEKHLFGTSDSEGRELLLVFVRARDALDVAPQAYPVGQPPRSPGWGVQPWDLPPDGNPLLPPKSWSKDALDAEINRVEKSIKSRIGPPGKS